MRKRKVCVVTGTRADYGLLFWLMKEIQNDVDFLLQTVVTGMHLSPEFGLTYKAIEEDGFRITHRLEMLLSSDTPVGIAKSIGLGVIGFAEVFGRLKPDILVILGDRFEILAAAQAAMVARIPIAHIHGGEKTEGCIDEAIRHSVTKMSHFHFVAAEPYRLRVIQLGEDPSRVFNVGAMGLDHLNRLKLLEKKPFEESIGFSLGEINFLVSYHPVTLMKAGSERAIKELFKALDHFPEARILFTKPNADTDGRIIWTLMEEYAHKNPQKGKVFTSLGQVRYLSAIKHVSAVIGNSSSGLIEVPAFKKPTINIGNRQKGRLRASSVVDCGENCSEIVKSIRKTLCSSFQKKLKKVVSPYGRGNAAVNVKNILKKVNLENVMQKSFFDLPIATEAVYGNPITLLE